MARASRPSAPVWRSANCRKHTSGNPLQRWLIGRFYRRILAATLATGARSVLDVGCGEGFVLRLLRERLGPASRAHLEGVDRDAAALAVARRLAPDVPTRVADARALPYADASFDLVLCLEVLEHLPDPQPALAELRRVARRHALLSVPHEPPFRLANLLRGKNLRAGGDDPGHVHHWGRADFGALLAEHFALRGVESSFPWLIALGEPLPGRPSTTARAAAPERLS